MSVKLYGFIQSTATRCVAQILYEKQVPFEFIEVDSKTGVHKCPSYLAKNPFGQVPYLDDEGFIVYESRAIARYIALKYADRGTALIPSTSDLKTWTLFEQAAAVESANFDPLAYRLIVEKIVKPAYKHEPTNEAALEEATKVFNGKLDAYEVILGKSKYLAGDELTLADLFHLPFLCALPLTGFDPLTNRPNVTRWANEISSRASWLAFNNGVVSKLTYD